MDSRTLSLDLWDVPEQKRALFDWIDARLAETGAKRLPEPPEVRVRAYSTTARIPTSRGPVWFKAAAPGSRFEAGLLAALPAWIPGHSPDPLATDPARGWSLLSHAGTPLRESAETVDLALWEEILGVYGELQRVLSTRVPGAIGLGLPDLRPEALGGWLDRFLDEDGIRAALGERVLAALEHDRPSFDADCAALAESGIAASIDHADLHTGNVARVDGRFVFFDWGDAVAAHPFTGMLGPLRHIERAFAPSAHAVARLRDAYLEPWTARHDRAHSIAVLETARRLGAITRALAWSRSFPETAEQARPQQVEQAARWIKYLVEPGGSDAL